MADLSTHYKELDPMQTVQNIKDFFEKNNFLLRVEDFNESEASTWYCRIKLYKNDILLQMANGKGVSKEYALASAHAELYERFCNGMTFLTNPYWVKAFTEENFKRYGYYFRNNEKKLSLENWAHCCKRADKFFKVLANDDDNLIRSIADFLTDGNYIGLPMQNINKQDTIYMDPRLLIRIQHSIGMAGGNTVEEALVQGISELIEKEGFDKFFKNTDAHFYTIKLENITNPVLRNIINKIHDNGYVLNLVDLSYTFNIPVMMAVLRDRERGNISLNFGCFPVWEVAAERTLTEIYQGIKSQRENPTYSEIRYPQKIASIRDTYKSYGNAINGQIFPLAFFDNLEYVESYNQKVYAPKEYSNEQLVTYFNELGEKLGYNFYYLDNSLNDKIHAVQILIDGENTFTNFDILDIKWSKIETETIALRLRDIKNFYNKILSNKKLNYLDCLQLISDRFFGSDTTLGVLDQILMWGDFLISMVTGSDFQSLKLFELSQNADQIFIPQGLSNSIVYIPFKKYLTLIRYVRSNKYTEEEILNIFNNIFNFNITPDELQKCGNYSYLLNKTYVEPLRSYLNSKDYKEIINLYVTNTNTL